jgi:glutamate synthase (NADPH/NADH) large chain
MLLIDLEQGRIVEDDELKRSLAEAEPYEEWLKDTQYKLEEMSELPDAPTPAPSNDPTTLLDRQQAFGYTQEDIQFFLEPMSKEADDPVGSMGTDTPIAVLSRKPKLLYNYFKQNFAQVTNPPIDPIREELVMSLVSMIGPRPNLLGRHAGTHKRLEGLPAGADQRRAREDPLDRGAAGRRVPHRHDRLHLAGVGGCGWTGRGARSGLLRGDRCRTGRPQHPGPVGPRRVGRARADPGAAATAAVHHHLIRRGLRTQTGLVVESGEVREVHHFCCLAGYGAEAINPYLAFETPGSAARPERPAAQGLRGAEELHQGGRQGPVEGDVQDGHLDLPVLLRRADLRRGRPAFRASSRSISPAPPRRSRARLAGDRRETVRRHRDAYGDNPIYRTMLDPGGDYAFRLRGEDHAWTPESVARLQHAVRGNNSAEYKAFAETINSRTSGC